MQTVPNLRLEQYADDGKKGLLIMEVNVSVDVHEGSVASSAKLMIYYNIILKFDWNPTIDTLPVAQQNKNVTYFEIICKKSRIWKPDIIKHHKFSQIKDI